ncbi:MAG: hypothetical protein R3A13_04955 [Bdellovibrionota bacterium]
MRSILSVLLIYLTLFCGGCDQNSDQTLDEIKGGLEKGIETARKSIESLSPDKSDTTAAAVDELEKLFRFEYKTFRISRAEGSAGIERELQELGLERWECFQVIDMIQEVEVYCKRRPKSYLRYFKAL